MRASSAFTVSSVAEDANDRARQQALLDLADRCSTSFYASTLDDKPWRLERPYRRLQRESARAFLAGEGSPRAEEEVENRIRRLVLPVPSDEDVTALGALQQIRKPSKRLATFLEREPSGSCLTTAEEEEEEEAGEPTPPPGLVLKSILTSSPSWRHDADLADMELKESLTAAELSGRVAQLFLHPLYDHRDEAGATGMGAALGLDVRISIVEKAYKITVKQNEGPGRLSRRVSMQYTPPKKTAGQVMPRTFEDDLEASLESRSVDVEVRRLGVTRSMRAALEGSSSFAKGLLPREFRHWTAFAFRALSKLRSKTYITFEYPESSLLAWLLSSLLILAILLSSISFCMETVNSLVATPEQRRIFNQVEIASIVIFTVDVGVRTLCCPMLLRFLCSFMTWIDYAAILPYYVELGLSAAGGGGTDGQQTRIVRIVRLVRVVRVLKLFRRFARIRVVIVALNKSSDMLTLLIVLVFLFMAAFSTMIYYCERGTFLEAHGYYSRGMPFDTICSDDVGRHPPATPQVPFSTTLTCVPGETPFNSIPASAWWCVVTLLTIGYGDVVPFSPIGKVVASVCMVFGLLLLSLPISVIGTQFTQEWLEFKLKNKHSLELNRRAPRFNALRSHLMQHNDMMEGVLMRTRDVLFDIDDLRVRLLDKHSHMDSERSSRRSIRRLPTAVTGSAALDMKHETQIIGLELELQAKLLKLQELLARADMLRNSDFTHALELCRTAYVKLQHSAATVASLVDEADDLEQAIDDALFADVATLVATSGSPRFSRFDGGGLADAVGRSGRWRVFEEARRFSASSSGEGSFGSIARTLSGGLLPSALLPRLRASSVPVAQPPSPPLRPRSAPRATQP